MSILCQTFVQNAWRSDLCSNCFKSLEDHSDATKGGPDRISTSTHRYVPQAATLYQSRCISTSLKWRFSEPLYDRVSRRDFASQTPPKTQAEEETQKHEGKGILVKNPNRKLRSRSSVDFASEEALVIGYGGNDYDSDLSPWEMGSDDGSIDLGLLDDTDEDRKITKMTKNNTEFNSSNQNLLVSNNNDKSPKSEYENANNLRNNNPKNNMFDKSPDKTLSITYNNIQKAKTVSQYYYPSVTENEKPYSKTSNNNNNNVNKVKNNKENSESPENCKIENSKRGNVNDENCKKILNQDFTPLNTRTYSFVSELNKNKAVSSEHSSDSDYSTCRLTAGDSTDSESFHDADEARIEPCPSFLHGNFPKNLSPTAIRELECDTKYDGGSSTSGDISNLSDDSDSHEPSNRTVYKTKNSKNSKAVTDAHNNNVSKGSIAITSPDKDTISTKENKTIQIRINESTHNKNKSQTVNSGIKENSNKISQHDLSKEKPSAPASKQTKKMENVVSIPVDAGITNHKPISNKSLNSTSVVENCENVNKHTKSDENKKAQSKTTSNKKQAIKDNHAPQKQITKQLPSENPEYPPNSQKTCTEDNANSEFMTDKNKNDGDEGNDLQASPDTIAQRQSKLAALALELELARRESPQANLANASAQITPPQPQITEPLSPNPVNVTEIQIPPLKGNVTPHSSKFGPLPDVLQETPTKSKKHRFSLKKLLKRNKDSNTFTPTDKESNPKAWKKQSFDRSRLSLEIVHPMDLTSDPATSGESTPTDENQYIVSSHPGKGLFKKGYSRARSLSALPQVTGESAEQSNCSLIECRKVETLPVRKAGTVAERKKNRPSLVRTPSCSALPNRSQSASPAEENDRTPPPKPPPPPKYKLQHPPPPPPPPHSTRPSKPNYPARPPPPKIPDVKYRNLSNKPDLIQQTSGDKEYANLGDIRSQLMPKKPERASALSVASRESETEDSKPEEEDHYASLDDPKVTSRMFPPSNDSVSRFKSTHGTHLARIRPWLDLQTSYSAIAATNYESLAELITSALNENIDYLKTAGRPIKFKDFTLNDEVPEVILPNKIICRAIFKSETNDKIILLIIPKKMHTTITRNQTRYPVLASFMDYIPKELLISDDDFASVYILQRSKITTIQKFAEDTAVEKTHQHIHLRNYCFVLLQLIHTLKSLQAEGIEEVNFDLEHLILVTTHEDKPPIFVLFPEDKAYLTLCDTSHGKKTLCQATLRTLYHFLNIDKSDELISCTINGERLVQPVAHTFSAIAQVLSEEKASSLTQAKGLLEYMLWGPVDVKVAEAETDDVIETVLQRWLDLQRAQMVKSTLSQLHLKATCASHMHVFEEYQLIFLLQASVKSLKNVISKL